MIKKLFRLLKKWWRKMFDIEVYDTNGGLVSRVGDIVATDRSIVLNAGQSVSFRIGRSVSQFAAMSYIKNDPDSDLGVEVSISGDVVTLRANVKSEILIGRFR